MIAELGRDGAIEKLKADYTAVEQDIEGLEGAAELKANLDALSNVAEADFAKAVAKILMIFDKLHGQLGQGGAA